MPTTVHIPPDLLKRLDERAREQGISRNRVIVHALERELEQKTAWPAGFLERFRNVDPELQDAVDEMMDGIRRNRRSKPPVKL